MSRKIKATKTTGVCYGWVMAAVVLGLVAVIVFRNLRSLPEGGNEAGAPPKQSDGKIAKQGKVSVDSHGKLQKSKRAELRKSHPRMEGVAPVFPLVEALLLDDRISDEEAASRFREIAQRADVSEEERIEALNHGLILRFEAFEGFAKDAALPVPIVQKYMEELANLSPTEAFRVSGLLDCLGHSNPEIRKQAAEQLAAVVEDEDLAGNPAALRREADKYLETLKLQPKEQ